jgi:hypothetical protein
MGLKCIYICYPFIRRELSVKKKVKGSRGQEVERSRGREVKRSRGREVERSRGREVKRVEKV